MGFGLLFIGYFMTYMMSINTFGVLFRLAGYCFMIASFVRLRKYNRAFDIPMYASVLMIAVTGVDLFVKAGELLNNMLLVNSFAVGENFKMALGSVDDACVFIFNACLLFAIHAIAKDVEDMKIVSGAIRNFIFVCIYYLLCAVSLLPFEFISDYKTNFSMPVYILYFVWIILNLVLIYTAYARICDESDVDMPLKRSRFEFVNKFREETAKREQKAADDSVDYAKKKLEERKNKRRR